MYQIYSQRQQSSHMSQHRLWVMSKIFIVINNPVWNYLEILFSPAAWEGVGTASTEAEAG